MSNANLSGRVKRRNPIAAACLAAAVCWSASPAPARAQCTPTLLGSYATPDSATAVSIVADVAYVADKFFGLQIIDVSGCGSCPPDCDGSGELDIDDFICFQTLFGLGDLGADCDGSGELDIDDFICFQTAYALGCL